MKKRRFCISADSTSSYSMAIVNESLSDAKVHTISNSYIVVDTVNPSDTLKELLETYFHVYDDLSVDWKIYEM